MELYLFESENHSLIIDELAFWSDNNHSIDIFGSHLNFFGISCARIYCSVTAWN